MIFIVKKVKKVFTNEKVHAIMRKIEYPSKKRVSAKKDDTERRAVG